MCTTEPLYAPASLQAAGMRPPSPQLFQDRWAAFFSQLHKLRILFFIALLQTYNTRAFSLLRIIGVSLLPFFFYVFVLSKVIDIAYQGLPYGLFVLPAYAIWMYASKLIASVVRAVDYPNELAKKIPFPGAYPLIAQQLVLSIEYVILILATLGILLAGYSDMINGLRFVLLLLLALVVVPLMVLAIGFVMHFACKRLLSKPLRNGLLDLIPYTLWLHPVLYPEAAMPSLSMAFVVNPVSQAIVTFRLLVSPTDSFVGLYAILLAASFLLALMAIFFLTPYVSEHD